MTPSGSLAKQCLAVLRADRDRLKRIKRYIDGAHDDPYMPDHADAEYQLLAKRAVTNWFPFLIETPVQTMFVDGFRAGSASSEKASKLELDSPQWKHWQDSRLDARQIAVHRAALGYGHAFVVTETDRRGRVVSKGLSPHKTAALFEDPANDDEPYVALTVTQWPNAKDNQPGKARMWDAKTEFEVTFKDEEGETKVSARAVKRHGNSECPVTRFAAMIDLDGNTTGVVEPLIPLNDRLNQTIFDLLVSQTYGSFKVRWVTGMAPPLQMEPVYEEDPETGEQVVVDYKPKIVNGQPVPQPINHNARRFLFAEDENVKFGSLDETPLGGFIEAVDLAMRHLSALSQTPPHHLLGQVANLSAEALNAAETAFSRKVETLRKVFGESWERVFRLAGELAGEEGAAADMGGEVIWRDMESRSLAQTADALGKMREQLMIPVRGLWRRVPGVTQNELDEWESLFEEESAELALAQAVERATGPLARTTQTQPSTRVAA